MEDEYLKVEFIGSGIGDYDWTLDGNFLVIAVQDGLGAAELYQWDFVKNTYQKLTQGEFCGFIEGVNRSTTSNEFVYFHEGVCTDEGRIISNLWNYNLDTGETVQLEYARLADWLPDGQTIINEVHLESLGYQVSQLSVSPDGGLLAFVDRTENDHPVLIFQELESGEITEITEVPSVLDLEWSPDGSWLVLGVSMIPSTFQGGYLAYNPENECFSDYLGLPEKMSGSEVSVGLPYIKWSPDGTVIALRGILGRVGNAAGHGIFFIESSSPIIEDWLSEDACLENLDS